MMRYPIAALLGFACANVSANVIQYYTGISYSNPAELFKVQKNEFIIGGTAFYADLRFSGNVLNFNTFQYDTGASSSNRYSLLPYGRIATRVDSKMVVGVDVTEPFHSNLMWGRHAVTRYAATETLLTDVEFTPRFSYSFTPQLYGGGGINFNFLKNNETNWALPVGPGPTDYDTLVNRTSGFGVGYNAGLYYVINQTNFLGAVYYSSIKQSSRGTSFLNGVANSALQFNFRMPSTTVLNYVHIFNPYWLASIQVFNVRWDQNQFARIKNTAAPPPVGPNFTFTMGYEDTWSFAAAVRHQLNDKLGLTAIFLQDNGPEQDHLRTINFPSDVQYFGGLSADYQVSKNTSVQFLYGQVYSNTLIANFVAANGQSIPFTAGRVRIHADVIELRFKIQT
ncbi:OmpP1/FadL family transporter [Legionella spiritensis]|uniref:Outer membrane protein n=1 Tax=Legionella spiritensis TaxID=452 RepID=A0A0W0YWU1_LEGSP|nr:outer membrane protein transport protein [Legionella spiritensis]KTD61381.1 outer membrane protein [Legionella spiritensis]SNV33642.1 outer membrane protein [Legionella spiritensis]